MLLIASKVDSSGAAGLVIFSQSGADGVGAFGLLLAASVALTAIFLGIAALLAVGSGGRRRARAMAGAVVVWFVSVALYDVAALGIASLLRSGPASRLLIIATLVNPVDAVRTGVLLAIQGTAAFGAASLALERFTHGPAGAGLVIAGSVAVWTIAPVMLAARRMARTDI